MRLPWPMDGRLCAPTLCCHAACVANLTSPALSLGRTCRGITSVESPDTYVTKAVPSCHVRLVDSPPELLVPVAHGSGIREGWLRLETKIPAINISSWPLPLLRRHHQGSRT